MCVCVCVCVCGVLYCALQANVRCMRFVNVLSHYILSAGKMETVLNEKLSKSGESLN